MRHLTVGLSAALLACIAGVVSAANTYPPGPPYRSCPDSVTLYQIQRDSTDGNNCQPAWGDTVLGVRGIVCGFRLRSTGRIYLENSNAADYNGLQIYTVGHTETQGIAVGDSISVCGVNGVYQNESQLLGTLGTSITVRKISSGNPLPPFRVGTTTDYKWTPASGPGSAYSTANPVEGMLVKVSGPLRVARIGPGAGLPANTAWLCVNANGSAAGDSIYVDGYQLTASNIISPSLGTVIDWVQGIMRRASPSGSDAWIISLRDQNDMSVQAPPNLSLAYPVADNKVRLVFDKNVDPTSAQNPANYALGSQLSGSTADNATLVGGSGNVVDVTITDVLPRLSTESIQTQNVGSETCPACLSPQQSLSFILGVLTCQEVQAPRPDALGGEPCEDRSVFAGTGSGLGERATVRGVFVKEYPIAHLFYFEDPEGGERSGVAAYNVPFGPVVGHQYLLACRVQEYYTMTELNEPVAMIDEGVIGVPGPELQSVAVLSDVSCDATQTITNAEDYEGVLVRVENVKVVQLDGTSFSVAGPAPSYPDTILVSNYDGLCSFAADTGMVVNVTGELFINEYGPRIGPRGNADITLLSGAPPNAPVLVWPAHGATGVSRTPTLRVRASDPDADDLTVQFYGRPAATPPAGPEFSLVLLPDTQFLTEESSGTNAIFKAQTQWIVDNRVSRNIAAVAHLGDVTDNDVAVEWMRADTAMKVLQNPVTTGLPDGIPYVMCLGNHDDNSGTTTLFNQYFGVANFSGRGYYGGHYGSNNDNSYILFSAAGRDFVLISLGYAPSSAVLAWADGVLAANPSRLGIVVSHSILNTGNPATWTSQGQPIYDDLKDRPNLVLMACGHMHGEGRRTDVYESRRVTSLLSDYQGYANGGSGYLRIMEFAPAANQVRVRTYSPWLNQWEVDADSSSQFTLNGVPLGGTTQPDFTLLGTVAGVPSGSDATFQWSGLDAVTPHLWYVNVSDGQTGRTGPTWAFTTGTTTDVEGTHSVLALAPPMPNPAHGAPRFSFDLPRAMRVRLDVIDVQGRVVAVLADGDFSPGSYERVWDTHMARNRAAGLYFVRLDTPEGRLVRRVVLLH
jgi:hypothetical protein